MSFVKLEEAKSIKEVADFVDRLPLSLKVKVNMHIYKDTYKNIHVFKVFSENRLDVERFLSPQS